MKIKYIPITKWVILTQYGYISNRVQKLEEIFDVFVPNYLFARHFDSEEDAFMYVKQGNINHNLDANYFNNKKFRFFRGISFCTVEEVHLLIEDLGE